MTTQSMKTEKSAPQSSVDIKGANFTNGLLLKDGEIEKLALSPDQPTVIGIDIGSKSSSFLVMIVDGMYIYEPL